MLTPGEGVRRRRRGDGRRRSRTCCSRRGLYQFKAEPPYVPGAEVAGHRPLGARRVRACSRATASPR